MLVKFTTANLIGKNGQVEGIKHETETYIIKFHHTNYWIKSKPNGKLHENNRRECECVIKQLIPEDTFNEFLAAHPDQKHNLQKVMGNHYFILTKAKAVSIEKSPDMYCKAIGREISLRKALHNLSKMNSTIYDSYFVSHVLSELHKQCSHGLERVKKVVTKEYLKDSRKKVPTSMRLEKKVDVKDEAKDLSIGVAKREVNKLKNQAGTKGVTVMVLTDKKGTVPNG